jgi:hypothetical protein
MGLLGYKPQSDKAGVFDSLDENQIKKILFQMNNCICKIKENKKDIVGTGFFLKIPFPDEFHFLPVLITCNHVLDINSIALGSVIEFTLQDDKIKKSIVINNSRKKYTSTEKDVTLIEIDPQEDKINSNAFLAVDENIYKDDLVETYKDKSVYVIHYEKGKTKKNSVGKITSIASDNFTIKHNCKTKDGSSGSPIINLENFGVMGIHKGSSNPKALNQINFGTLLKIPIDEFNNSESKPIIQSIPKKISTYQTKTETRNFKKISSYQTKTETGNFYVSNIYY